MSVKTMRYEIVGWVGDDPKESKSRWRAISDDCREIVNTIWQQWEVYHVTRGNDLIARKYESDLIAYRRKETSVKPKLDLQFWPPEFSKQLRKHINSRFPNVHSRTKDLLCNLTQQRMRGKDVEGRWNIWLAVLLNRQGRPNSTHHVPIPFDSQNSKPLKLVEEKYTNYTLAVNLTRVPSDGKNSPSIEDRVQLKARGNGRVIVERIVAGQYKFCGSSIVYHSGKNKWFCLLAYNNNIELEPPAEPKGVAILRSRQSEPWALRVNGRNRWLDGMGGRGRHIAAARVRLLTGRWSRQENYRHAGSSNKGHGLRRAMQGVQRLSEGWKNFVKTCNHNLTSAIVKYCVESRIARIVYVQPTEAAKGTRYLSWAGKVPGRIDSTGWDWAQVATMLGYKCKDAGVHFELRKSASGVVRLVENASGKASRSQKRSGAVAVKGVATAGVE